MVILIIYVPPNLLAAQYDSINEFILSSADIVLSGTLTDCSLIMAGDLNQFSTATIEETLGVLQIVDKPTRKASILDKILICPRLLEEYGPPIIGPNFGNGDHQTVMIRPMVAEKILSR